MKPARKVSRSGLELIKQFEGFRRSAARLADGRWTVGYSHLKFAKEGVELSEADAETLLVYDLLKVAEAVNGLVYTPLSQNQFDALASFAFNVGLDNFRTSSVLRRTNEGDLTKAAFALEVWRRAPFEDDVIVVDALVRRRAAEKALFLRPDEGFVPAPTPVLPPEIDYEAENRPPAERPAALITPLEGATAEAYRASDSVAEPAPAQAATAMQAVSERLEALLPHETADQAGDEPVAAFPAASAAAPPAASATATQVVEPMLVPEHLVTIRPRPPAKSPLRLLGASAAGILLFGYAVFSRLNAGGETSDNAGGQGLTYIAGILGVICIFYAAYLLLERFAGDDD
jgi:lysozyme